MLLWNLTEDDKSKKGCKIEKNRQGECGKIVLKFNGDLMKFQETNESVQDAKEWKKVEENPFE
jgi:replicative DNA helicase